MKKQTSAIVKSRKINFAVGEFLFMFAILMTFSAALFAISELSKKLSDTLSAVCYGLAWGFSAFLLFGCRITNSKEVREKLRNPGNEVEIALPICACLFFPFFFGMFCRELQAADLVHFNAGAASTFLTWVGFGFESILDHIFFDVPSTFDLRITSISPDSLGTKLLLASYRIVGTLFVVETLFRYPRLTRQKYSEE